MKLKEAEFTHALKLIEGLLEKEVMLITTEENPDEVNRSLYKATLYNKLLDIDYIVSKKVEETIKKLVRAIKPLNRDELFAILVIFTKTILDTISIIKDEENKPIFVDVTTMFNLVLKLLNVSYDIPNLAIGETTCVVCGNKIIVEQGKEDFAIVCKACQCGV